jgi:hypothetical protein
MRNWSLIRMECCPTRSPARASRRLPGGLRKSFKAHRGVNSFESATCHLERVRGKPLRALPLNAASAYRCVFGADQPPDSQLGRSADELLKVRLDGHASSATSRLLPGMQVVPIGDVMCSHDGDGQRANAVLDIPNDDDAARRN